MQATLARQNLAMWCSGNEESPVFPVSLNTRDNSINHYEHVFVRNKPNILKLLSQQPVQL